jgi:uncharacterized membrane protein YqjE
MATDIHHDQSNETMTGLVQGIIADVEKLTKQQFHMLKVEVKEDLGKTVQAGTVLAAGLAVLFIGGLLLCVTIAYLLTWAFDFPVWGGFAIVTGVLLTAGLILLFAGLQKFRSFNPLPDKTAEALKENVEWLTKNT